MKTIIFPCNGKTDSLDMFRTVLDIFVEEPVNCIFLEVRALPDNYNDLVTISRKRGDHQGFNAVFTDALKELCSNCPADSLFSIDHIYGGSPAVFRNYADHRGADVVVFDHQQWKANKDFSGKDIFRMVSRSKCEIIYVSSSATIADKASIHLNSNRVKVLAESNPLVNAVSESHEFLYNSSAGTAASLKSAPAGNVTATANTTAPSSVKQQYQSVDSMLNELESTISRNRIVTKKISNLSRYFLKESTLQKMLNETDSTVIWIKNN